MCEKKNQPSKKKRKSIEDGLIHRILYARFFLSLFFLSRAASTHAWDSSSSSMNVFGFMRATSGDVRSLQACHVVCVAFVYEEARVELHQNGFRRVLAALLLRCITDNGVSSIHTTRAIHTPATRIRTVRASVQQISERPRHSAHVFS